MKVPVWRNNPAFLSRCPSSVAVSVDIFIGYLAESVLRGICCKQKWNDRKSYDECSSLAPGSKECNTTSSQFNRKLYKMEIFVFH